MVFYLLCTLTGQYPVNSCENNGHNQQQGHDIKQNFGKYLKRFGMIVSIILTGVLLLVNLGSLAFDMYIIIVCPYAHCGYINIIKHASILNLTNAENISNGSGLQGVQPVNLTMFDDWQKTVFTTATLSGTVSYLFMIFVLYSQYSVFTDCVCDKVKTCTRNFWESCGEKPCNETSTGILKSPFKDNDNDEASRLSPKQACYFVMIFTFNAFIYGGNVVLLFVIFQRGINKRQKGIEITDAIGLTSQFVSQLCAIFSCFIFSKVAYSIGSTCVDTLPDLFKNVGGQEHQVLINHGFTVPNDASENPLPLLKAIAKWYNDMLNRTLKPFGTWFAVHWVLYTLTAFMSISYVAETIILELYGTESADKKCHGETKLSCRLKLAYVFLFAIEHCILFLYPCFRAASVTTAYTSMIKRVSNDEWVHISADIKEKFLNYLKIQDCTFKISILCAKLSFGFNVAYFSIFVGILGVTLKLAL